MSDGNKEIMDTLSTISESLKTLVDAADIMKKVSVASVIYPNDTFQTLLFEYKALELVDAEAFNQITKAGDELKTQFGDLSFEKRAKQFGNDKAMLQIRPMTDAIEHHETTIAAISAFRTRHPIIASLHDEAIRKPK